MREGWGRKGHTIDATPRPHAFNLLLLRCLLQQSSSTTDIILRDLKMTIVENWRRVLGRSQNSGSAAAFRPASHHRDEIESLGIF